VKPDILEILMGLTYVRAMGDAPRGVLLARTLPGSFTSGSHLGATVDADASEGGPEMRRGVVIAAVIVTILAGIGIGVGAYRAGEDAGITQGIEQVQTA
jgi:hypothetical protein